MNKINTRVGVDCVTAPIEQGLSFIISHFDEPVWPRTIFTPKEKQVLVYTKDEALAKFRQARFLDCRINACPSYTEWKELNRQAPNSVFIDLDLSRCKSIEELNSV